MSPPARRPVAVLISGNGSNLEALVRAGAGFSYQVAGVVSSSPGAYGLERAARLGVPSQVVDHRRFDDRAAFDRALAEAVAGIAPDLVALAGFMRVLGGEFVRRFHGRLLNLHPSLLPRFPGAGTHQRAIDAGEREHGATVHFVTEELDAGPVVAQARVPVLDGDTAEALAERVRREEHVLYPKTVSWFTDGRLRQDGDHAVLDGVRLPPAGAAPPAQQLVGLGPNPSKTLSRKC